MAGASFYDRLTGQYSPSYFDWQQAGSRRSAEVIAPLLQERLQPRSVIDVGCGPGAWPAVWRELGVEDVCGLDAGYVRPADLLFPAEQFVEHDLRLPFELGRRFDLVLCLEAAQHLPAEVVDGFLDCLTALGSTILFSSAVPFQGGDNHINEQWQSWWVEQFLRRGYAPHDVVRPAVWDDGRVDWWYAQNALLYVQGDDGAEAAEPPTLPYDIVHPRNYLTQKEPVRASLRLRARRAAARVLKR